MGSHMRNAGGHKMVSNVPGWDSYERTVVWSDQSVHLCQVRYPPKNNFQRQGKISVVFLELTLPSTMHINETGPDWACYGPYTPCTNNRCDRAVQLPLAPDHVFPAPNPFIQQKIKFYIRSFSCH